VHADNDVKEDLKEEVLEESGAADLVGWYDDNDQDNPMCAPSLSLLTRE
jgi:hypothetical protein